MAQQSQQQRFQFGDRVRHTRRPEWGIGSVIKAELVSLHGQPSQRLSIRFANAGLKTLTSALAELELVTHEPESVNGTNGQAADHDQPMDIWRTASEPGWLEPLARKKIDQTMTALAAEARDPFNSLRQRLTFTLNLFRFDRTGGKLIDWAVAQSGLKDPLSRFTRQELEQLFDRWTIERDNQLARLLNEVRPDPAALRDALTSATQGGPAARQAVKKFTAR